ncbi:MAG: M20 family metallopeptidase [Chloroflexota bacterium]|nr:M20 family metallopeptidase [Chloroflexota bacterium]
MVQAEAVDLSAVQENVVAAIEAERDDLIALSRFIHAHPEIAMQETASSAACAAFLERRGFAVERNVAGLPTAFRASVAGSGERPTIAYLAEYDALPGLGHGCGHNLIAIAGIGAGIGLRAALNSVPGTVTVFGTPAEEAIGGKAIMSDAGIFDGIDAAMGAHPGTVEAVCPTVEGSGQALACQAVRIEFVGRPAHAAADPYNGINGLNALIETFNGINALRQHICSDARIHGIITHGGEAPNVVPSFAAGDFLIRAQTMAYMNELVEKVRRVAEGAAAMTGSEVRYLLPERATFDMITNHTLARRIKTHLDALGLAMPEAVPEEGSGSTDWGNVSYVVPSVETGFPILDRVCTWHSPEVVEAADAAMGYENTITVAKALALAGLDLLTDAALLRRVKGEFAETRAARGG